MKSQKDNYPISQKGLSTQEGIEQFNEGAIAHAQKAVQKKNWAEAINRWQKVFLEYNNQPPALVYASLSTAHRMQGNMNKAEDIVNQGLKKYPNDRELLLVLVKTAKDKQDWPEATKWMRRLEQISNLQESSDQTRNTCGYRQEQTQHEANKYLDINSLNARSSVSHYPENKAIHAAHSKIEAAYKLSEEIIKQEKVKEVGQLVLDLIRNNPERPDIQKLCGHLSYYLNMPDQALYWYQKANPAEFNKTQHKETPIAVNIPKKEYKPRVIKLESPRSKEWMHINWVLTRRCNFSCSYCTVHNNKDPLANLENLKKAVDNLSKIEKKLDIALTGGEPTIHPSYLDFIQYILQKNPESRVMTQTNLSLKGGVYQKFYDRFKNSAVRLSFWASYHFEQANRETFLGNANILSQAFPVKIIVMAHPEHMHDVRQLYEYVSSLDNPNLKIYVKLIRENFGAIPDKRYTQQDLDWLTNFWNSYEGDTVEDFFDKVKVYMQSPTNEGCETRNYTPDDLINKDLNNFKGMLCNAGIEALSIDQFGNMAPAVCLRGAKIKKPNIFKDKDPLKHFQKPIRCPKNKCGCLADIPITKWNNRYLNNFHEKELVSNHDENKRGEKQSQESEDPKEKFQNKINNPLNKVLLLARSFPPYDGGNIGRSLRIYHLANFLAANNYEVYVFIFHKLVQDREHPEIHKNIKLLNHDFNARNKNFQDINDVTDYCSEIINNYNIDTIISSSPPLDAHIVAKNIKQKNRIIFWICDIRNITSMHMNLRKKNKKEHMIQKHQEVETISYADAITTVSTGASKIINDLYNEVEVDRSLSKIYVVENGYIDTENVPAQKEVLSYINEARYENRIILYYAGTGIISGNRNIMKSKDVTLLIDNIANYEDIRNNFALIIQGNVAINEEYIKKIHPKVKLKILPRVENKQIRSNLKNADIGVIVSRDYISAPTLMSGKLYDYISCGLSLFLIIPENSYSRLEFASKHDKKVFIANPHKDNSIKDAFYKILNLKANLNEIKFVKNEVLQYNRYLQYEKILEILKNKNYKIYNDFSCIHNGSAFKHVPSESLPPDIKVSPNKNDDSNLLQHLDNIGWEEKTEIYSQYFESVTFLKKIDNPKMSIVVISWRLHPDTIKNFQILEKQRDQNFELIFVDNGGKPGEFDELKPFIDTYVRLNSNTGAYLARNVGAAFAKAPILFFLEDDGIPADDIVHAHLDAHEKYDVIAVRGVYQPRTNNPLNSIAKHYYLGSKPFPIYADLEGNTSYLASAFFKVGGWDDEIRFGGGGVDLSRRLLDVEPDIRKQIYSPDPVILHDYAKNQEHYDQKRSKQKKSHARLRRKHPDYGRFLSMWAQFRGNHSLLIHKASNKKKIKYKPFISICIPTYNRADFIISGINSALRQTYKNFEIIIVDDGSTDDTKTIINKFNNKNIKYILKNHSGAPETRNICIANAKGDYILWLDSDDLISETLLEEYVEIINKINDIDVVYSNHFCVDMDGYIINKYTHFDWYNKNQEMILRFLTKNPLPNLGTLVKKSLYDELGGYNIEFPRAHDMEFWSRVALANKYKCKHLNKYLNYIRIHDRNITGLKNPIKTNFEYEVKITKKIINEIGIENIYYNQANKEISKQVAYAKVVDRFMELYAFKEVESYCNEYLAFHRNNSVFLDKKNILRETVANFILHYHIFKFLKKIKHSPIIDEYYNFVSSKIISFSDYNSQINFNMSQAITALTEQAHKYFLKKEYYISIYLYHGLLMLDENNIDLLKIISTLYMMIENYGSAINYLERACAIESNNAEINSLLLRAREAISSRDKIYIS